MKNIRILPLLIFFVGVVLIFYIINDLKNDKIKEAVTSTFESKASNLVAVLDTLIDEKQKSTLNISLSMAQNENIIRALKINDASILHLDTLSKRFKEHSEYKNLWFQIITKDGYSFSRSWTNQKGDYLLKARKGLKELIQKPKQSIRISVGKYDLTFKSIIPIYDNNKLFLGFIETISHFNSISSEFRKEGIDSIFLADKRYKKQLIYPFNKNFLGDYYVANTNADELILKYLEKKDITQYIEQFLLKDYFVDKKLNKLVVYKPIFSKTSKSIAHLLIFYPLDNFSISQIEDIKYSYNIYFIIVVFIMIVIAMIFYLNSFKNEEESVGNINIILILFIIYVLLSSAIYFILNYGITKHVKGHLVSQKEKILSEYNLIYQKNKDISNFIFESYLDTRLVKEMFKSKDRKTLYNHLKKDYKSLKEKYNIKQIHFHDKDSFSFLRMNNPKKYLDSLKNIRSSVDFVNKTMIPYDGFEIGRSSGSYRYIFPLDIDNVHIGSVEISFDIYSVLSQFHTNLNNNRLTFLLRNSASKDKLSDAGKQNYIKSPLEDFYFDKKLLQRMKSDNIHMQVRKKSQEEIASVLELVLKAKPFTISLRKSNEIITGIPILNIISKEVVGTIQVSTNNDSVREVYSGLYIAFSIIAIILALIMIYIYNQISSKYKLSTLNKELENNQNILTEAIDNFQNVLDATTQMIVIFNKKREIQEINRAGVRILGYKNKEELLSKNILDFVCPADLKMANQAIKKNKEIPYELRMINTDGKVLTTIVSAKNIMRAGVQMRMASIVDVTELKQKEEIFQQQSRLAQMGEMISMIAHQWRQPLGAISTAVFGIETKIYSGRFDFDEQEDRERFLEFMKKKHMNINSYVQSLSETIDDFRNFFKPDKAKENIELTIPINRALNIVNSSMSNKGIIISTEFNSDDKLYLYQNEIMQVLLNILKNSEDNFIEKNIKNGTIFIRTYKEQNNCIISIIDNGGGIDEEIIANIFDPYYSTKDEKNGTGLGLYMSKIMIEEHNSGSLTVSNIQNGVEFKIIFDILNNRKEVKNA